MAITPALILILCFIGAIVALTGVYFIERSFARIGAFVSARRTQAPALKI